MPALKREIGLYLSSHEVAVEVRINDVPLAVAQPGSPEIATLLNPWILTGANQLQVRIERFDPNIPPVNPALNLSIRPADVSSKGPHIVQFQWPNPNQKANDLPAANPSDVERFEIPDPGFGPFVFAQSAPSELTRGLEDELATAVASIFAAFSQKDVSRLMALGEWRDAECAACWGMDTAKYRASVRNDWSQLFKEEGFAIAPIEPLDRNNLKFIPCWKNRLFRVLRLDGGSPLSTMRLSAGYTVSYDIYLARPRDKWIWIR